MLVKKQPKGNKKQQSAALVKNRSKSRSRSVDKAGKQSPKNNPLKKSISPADKNKAINKKPDNKLKNSASKKSLKRSLSQKNIKRSQSKGKVNQPAGKYHANVIKENHQQKVRRNSIDVPTNVQRSKNAEKEKSPLQPKAQQKIQKSPKQERQMGLILSIPPGDKIQLKALEVTDTVYQKYLEMIINDNDISYVLNALPEFQDLKKKQGDVNKDFIKSSKISEMFNTLNLEKLMTPMKKVPQYYKGPNGKNLKMNKLILVTKFKVNVDIGFIQYSLDHEKVTIFRFYISKIYRRMNYLGYVHLEVFKNLMQRHGTYNKWSIFVLEQNQPVHKFFKYLGFKIQRVATQSKNKQMNYFQEFNIEKKDLQTVISGNELGLKA